MSVIDEYAALASDLIDAYCAVSDTEMLRPVAHLLPKNPARILDVGAGTGRTAAWFAGQGMDVTAIEPVAAFRAAGQARYEKHAITWIDDALPDLGTLHQTYDLILLAGVWHHLCEHERATALPRLASLLAASGQMILSLRHGPAPHGRTVYDVPTKDTVALAHSCGLTTGFTTHTASIQAGNRAAGVTWTWLCLHTAAS
ncbi:MAG: class I SAM-dependent methyltransferase [Pseudomonadota bacterium]